MIGLFILVAVSTSQCPPERAHYTLRHSSDVSAYFRKVDSDPDWPSGLALAIHYKTSNQTFWWLPWNGGTNGLRNVASTTDVTVKNWQPPNPDGGPRPYGNRQYLGLDADYNIINDIPREGSPAPAHMLFPDSAGSGDIAFSKKQFFDLISCSASDS
ncbi:hypothetical protein [Sphingobium aquiterrae]|uniref:hypothetical protein n=1 Tax=Sphingobium aquiterrae TaxID=2038656 RepID=UPI00301B0EE3